MVSVQPVRRPLDGLSPYDDDAVIRWALQRAADEIVRSATLRPRMVLVLDDHLAEVDLLEQTTGDPIATFESLAGRADIEHRLLFGCFERAGTWTAWVFGARNDEERSFWIATSRFEVRPGGLGAGSGSWDVIDGVELGGIHFPASTLARPEPAMSLARAVPLQNLQIEGASHDNPPGREPPREVVQATDVVSEMGFEMKAWREGLDGRLVLIFREKTWDEWHITGEIPVGLDDLVRSLCLQDEQPAAVVAMWMDVLQFEGEHYRVVKMVAEAAGMRFQRLLALWWADGDTDEPSQLRPFLSLPTEAGTDGWIGVQPITEIKLFPLGPTA